MCSGLLLAGMICHFYRKGFCSNRSVMLRRLMPRVERLYSIALVAGGRMPRTPRRMSAELKLSHPTKSSLRCVGGIFLFQGRLHLENFMSRPSVILAFRPTPLQNRGRNFVRVNRRFYIRAGTLYLFFRLNNSETITRNVF